MGNGIDKIRMLEKGRRINALRIKRHDLQQLFWECTLRCNLKCRHCGSSCQIENSCSEMPLKDFIPVLEDIKAATSNPILVITTGGEPLLREDICECGREITKRGFYWGMVTNGMLLTESKLHELMTSGLNSISISLDGLEDEHNWMRGNVKSFGKAIHAIKLLCKVSHSITWDIITCINKRNLHQLPDMKQYLISLGVKRWKIFSVFPMGRATEHQEMELNKEEFLYLMNFIVEARIENRIKISYGCENFLGPYEYEVRDGQYFCGAGINVASILHDGSISGCLSIRSDYTQGSIYDKNFMDVWEHHFEKYRNPEWKKTAVCKECEVWRWCNGNGMHLRDNEGKLKQCYYRILFYENNNNKQI